MTDKELLNQIVTDSGVTKTWLSKKAGISRPRLYKILGGAECNASEMTSLSEALHMTNVQFKRVFFAQKVV